jgi:hypothetical protein
MLILYDTLVLGLELPATVVAAINRKVEQYYLVQEYAFRVDRERKESERKQIEAYGIRDFQQTVTQGISDSYVRWRGIEATLQLAQSPNTKIVIIGSGKDGLPVILGNVDTPIAPQPPAGGATAPDNSEAAKQKPAAASPPMLEKTPASNLPTPAERPAPPSGPGAQPSGSSTQPAGPGPQAPPGAPGRQSSAPNQAQGSSWTLTISELQELLARALRSNVETTGQGAPPPGGPGAPPPPAPSFGSAPHSPTSPPHAEPRMNTPPQHGPEPAPARSPEGPRSRPQ